MGQEKIFKKKDFTGMLTCIKARNLDQFYILFCLLIAFSLFWFFKNSKRRKKRKKKCLKSNFYPTLVF